MYKLGHLGKDIQTATCSNEEDPAYNSRWDRKCNPYTDRDNPRTKDHKSANAYPFHVDRSLVKEAPINFNFNAKR